MGQTTKRVPKPAEPPASGELPRTLTFVLTADERAGVLRVLRRYGADRTGALVRALGIERDPPAREGRRGAGHA